ncbi:MAG: hypothetical protein K6E54_02635 [Bacteroidaceae bacterium]|nr:hypothetical protein [Bacteroidaceae bacterium]
MKLYKIHTLGLVIMSVSAIISCSDVKDLDAGLEYADRFDNHGAPVIEAIYDVYDEETPITSGTLNQYIVVKGQNLAQAKEININGLEVDIKNRVYATTTASYIRIPRAIPENETGVLSYKTDQGTTEIAFPVSIPELELEGLKNEFAIQGSRVQLSGDYFDLYNFNDTTETSPVSILIYNESEGYSEEVKLDSCTETYASLTIPTDCPDNSLIKFSWQAMGGGEATKTIPYRMSNMLMLGNFDGELGSWSGNTDYITDGTKSGDPESLGYQYWRFNCTLDSWAYYGIGWWVQWKQEWDAVTANPSNYYFKFEVCTSATTPFYDYGTNGTEGEKNGGYNFSLNGGANYQWDPCYTGLTNTSGKWVTVRIPLEDVVDPEKGLPSFGGGGNLAFICQPNGSDSWTLDHSFGQFRIEPKNY